MVSSFVLLAFLKWNTKKLNADIIDMKLFWNIQTNKKCEHRYQPQNQQKPREITTIKKNINNNKKLKANIHSLLAVSHSYRQAKGQTEVWSGQTYGQIDQTSNECNYKH